MQIVNSSDFFRISSRMPKTGEPVPPQTREGSSDAVLAAFNEYAPLKDNLDLFRVLRESIPFIDSAILIRKLLLGKFQIETYGKEGLKAHIEDFIDNVQVNWFNKGLWSFIGELHDATDESGYSVGEYVPLKTMNGIHRLKTCRSTDFIFAEKEGKLVLCTYKNGTFNAIPLPNMDLIYYLAYDTRQGHPQGKSLLYSMVTHGQVYLRWLKSFENYTMRFGDPTIAVSIEPPEGTSPKEVTHLRDSIFTQLQNVFQLRRQGKTGDLGGGIPGGKVSFSTLGADAELKEQTFSIRTILENIVAKTGIPPYMLGISWASTERMSQMQADKIVSNINNQRLSLEPILRRIIDTYLVMTRQQGQKWDLVWEDVLLLDEVEVAKAFLFNEQAREKQIMNIALQIGYGWMTEEEARDYLREMKILKSDPPAGWFREFKGRQYVKEMAKNLL
ncbi:hypothetical protein [Neomegalonema sp.]|uniref:phage portal protein family protein n=1 Tax=Neomegalonema sp. TaxID=2039713 RepID=UPI002622902C|nr:hypothetical protein [Neomegalonema sp.]MDD2869664.1 hypothetical protein [Neomegalonema sp.]